MGGALQLFERPQGGDRAVLVGVGIGHPVDPNDIAEFAALAASAGTVAVGTVLASRARPDPKYFVGSGKAEEIRAFAEAHQADLVLVDQTLTPSQERNLEKLTGRRVLDRNGLILDIFAQRARSFDRDSRCDERVPVAIPPHPRAETEQRRDGPGVTGIARMEGALEVAVKARHHVE